MTVQWLHVRPRLSLAVKLTFFSTFVVKYVSLTTWTSTSMAMENLELTDPETEPTVYRGLIYRGVVTSTLELPGWYYLIRQMNSSWARIYSGCFYKWKYKHFLETNLDILGDYCEHLYSSYVGQLQKPHKFSDWRNLCENFLKSKGFWLN